MVHPGSEFREVSVVEELWRRHELWPKMRRILEEGVEYPLEDISEEERKNDLEYMMCRGNHKSSMEPRVNTETLKKTMGRRYEEDGCYPSR